MARRIQGLEQGSVRTFVPISFDNRADPEPVSFDYRVPTEAGYQNLSLLSFRAFQCPKCKRVHRPKTETTCPGVETAEELVEQRRGQLELYRQVVKSFVDLGRNYEVRGKKIDSGEALAQYGEDEFLAETALEVFGSARLSDSQKKSSVAQPSSSSPATSVSAGAAILDAITIEPPTEAAIATQS